MCNKFRTIGEKINLEESQEQAFRRETLKEVEVEIQELYFLNMKEYTKEEKYLLKWRIVHTCIIKINKVPESKELYNMGEWQQIKWKKIRKLLIIESLVEYYNL